MKKIICLCLSLLIIAIELLAQNNEPINFSFDKSRLNDREVLLTIKAKLKPGIKLYSIEKVSDDIPYSSISFDSSFEKNLSGAILEKSKINKEKDSSFASVLNYIT